MKVSAEGLSAIFAYDSLLPGQKNIADVFPPPGQQSNRDFLEQCVKWVRDATGYLARFAQFEQGYVQPISLKVQVGDAAWGATLEKLSKKEPVTFKITEDSMNELWSGAVYHVRLRGISVFAVHDDPNSIWQTKVRAPVAGYFRPLPDPSTNEPRTTRTLSQESLPPCRFGRTRSRSSPQAPDVSGTVSLYNACPFGDWDIWAHPRDIGGRPISEIKDIQLDLYLICQSPFPTKN